MSDGKKKSNFGKRMYSTGSTVSYFGEEGSKMVELTKSKQVSDEELERTFREIEEREKTR